jgi:hypothetical protein
MDDVKEFVAKYWPYIVGGIVGLFLILRFSGGSSSGSSSGDGGYGAFLQAQTAAGAQNAALQLQAQTANNQMALESKALQAKIDFDNAALQVQNNANYAVAFNDFQMTQAAMAQSIGSSTAAVIDALNAPSIMAMQTGAFENAAALEAAGVVAASSFATQGQIVATSSQTAGQMAQALQGVTSNVGNLEGPAPEGKWSQAVGLIGRAYGAYTTGGVSEAYRGSTQYDSQGYQMPSYMTSQQGGGGLAGDRYSRSGYSEGGSYGY